MNLLKREDLKKALTLVQNVDDANYSDKDNSSLLMLGSLKGYPEVCKILLDKGAKLDLQANDAFTALMVASQEGHTEFMKLLLDKGAKLDLQDTDGWTALMRASHIIHAL